MRSLLKKGEVDMSFRKIHLRDFLFFYKFNGNIATEHLQYFRLQNLNPIREGEEGYLLQKLRGFSMPPFSVKYDLFS